MFDEIIYMKTEKGLEEIERRSYNLPRRLRSALIMIDGHTAVVFLRERFLSLGDPAEIIESLLVDGFIRPQNTGVSKPESNKIVASPASAKKTAPIPVVEVTQAAHVGRELKCVLHLNRCSGESCVMSNGCLKFNSMK
jgi:hypothetical protein